MKNKKFKIFITFVLIFLINVTFFTTITNATDIDLEKFNAIAAESTHVEVSYIGGLIHWAILILNLILVLIFIIFIIKDNSSRIKINKLQLSNDEKLEKLKELSKKNSKKFIKLLGLSFIIQFIIVMLRSGISFDKPLIYLYPEKEQNVIVKLGHPEDLTCTYPKYIDSWEVYAKPNGDLIDLSTGRTYYGLYWEGKNSSKSNFNEGFCVEGSKTIEFLEEKLKILGLTEREANEFIIYWLPQLECNKYNLIRFQTIEEMNNSMPLEISPKPDTIIRVMMEFKPLNRYVEIEKQELSTPERTGFVVVEWGGTKL